MINEPTLSICIPTYNRLEYLKALLDNLLPLAQSKGVEVCVSDNNSMDGTKDYIHSIAKYFTHNFRYKIQGNNIGIDRNMMEALGLGSGKYIYPLGDDDMLLDNSLDELLGELNNDFDLLVLNGWHTDPELTPNRKHLSDELSGWSTQDPTLAFTALWDKMPFGSIIADRNCFVSSSYDKYIGTSHAYAGAVWDTLALKNTLQGGCIVRCGVVPTVLLRGAKKTWAKNAAVIMLSEIPLWFNLISKSEVYLVVAREIRNQYLQTQMRPSNLLKFRMIGQLEAASLPLLTANFNKYGKLIARVISGLPMPLVKVLYRINLSLRSLYKDMGK
jgi:glycosyltransferase involved in cell wall biosynthesis